MTARSDALLGAGTGSSGSSRAAALLSSGGTFDPFEGNVGGGPFGFIGNVAEEAKGMVTGLGQLVGTGLHDIGRGLGQALPGRQDWGIVSDNPVDSYRLDDVATQFIPAVWEDLRTRYGPLFRGDLDEFAHQLYERPLSFGLDALAVGGAAASGARIASRLGLVKAGGALERLLPQETARLVGTEVQRGFTTGNPVRRLIFEKPFERFATRPIADLEQEAGALRAVVDSGYALPAQQAELARLTEQLRAAAEGGATRVYKSALETRLLRKMTDRLIGAHFQKGLAARDEDLKAIGETLEPLAQEGISDDIVEAEFQRLSTSGQDTWGPEFLPETKVFDPDTGAAKEVFHGSPTSFEGAFDISKSPGGLYGRGFYFTEDPKIASGYAKGDMVAALRSIDDQTKRELVNRIDADLRDMYSPPSAPEGWHAWADFEQDRALSWLDDYATGRNGPQLLELLMEQPYNVPIRKIVDEMGLGPPAAGVRKAYLDIRNPFDIEARVPAEAEESIRRAAIAALQGGTASFWKGYSPRTMGRGVDEAINKVNAYLTPRPGFPPIGSDLYENLKRLVGEDGVTDILRKAGYDGITHIGGQISGGKAHRVWIAFDPEQVRAPWMEATQFGAGQRLNVPIPERAAEQLATVPEGARPPTEVMPEVTPGNEADIFGGSTLDEFMAPEGAAPAAAAPAAWKKLGKEGPFGGERYELKTPEGRAVIEQLDVNEAKWSIGYKRPSAHGKIRTRGRWWQESGQGRLTLEQAQAQAAEKLGSQAPSAPGNIASASAAEMATASRSASAPASRGAAEIQPPSGVQLSRGPSSPTLPPSKVRSSSPLAFQYLGPEATTARSRAPFHAYSNTQAFLDASTPAEQELRQTLEQTFGAESIQATRIKGADRLAQKLETKALLAKTRGIDAPPDSFLPTIADGIGARVEIGSWNEVPAKLEQLRQAGIQILEIDDFAGTPHSSGYRGQHATVRLPSGFVGEVQFQTPLSYRVAEAGHLSYETLRNLYHERLQLKAAGEAIPESLEREYRLTKAYVRRFQEPVLREMEEHLRGRPMSTMDRVMENMRLLVQERLTNPMIEKGLLTPAEAMERAYLPLRIADGAKYDYETGGFVGGRDVLDLDQMLDAQGVSAPIYFPHVDVRKTNFSDFISLSKQTIGARRATRPRYAERNTGYLASKGLYAKNAREVYSRRAAQAVRYEETYRFVSEVAQRFGRRISKADELNPATERLFAPDGLIRFFRQQMHVRDAATDIMAAAKREDEHMADALKAVMEPVQDELGEIVTRTGVGVTRRGVEMYAIPKAVAERLEAHVRPLLGPNIERNVRLFWDTPTNAWRGIVLTGSPRWVVNNTLGNIVFLKMQGGRLRDVVYQLSKRFRKKIGEVPGIDETRGGFFGAGSQYLPKRGSANLTAAGQMLEAGSQLAPVRALKGAAERIRRFNGAIEDAFRKASYLKAAERSQLRASLRGSANSFNRSLGRLERLSDNGMSDNAVRQALDEVNYFFNDYSAATPFGRQIIRRFVAPFWSFYRHVLKLSVTWPIDYPLRAEVLRGLTNVSNDIVAEYGPLPPWAEGALPLGPPGLTAGPMEFLSTRGANPFNTLFQAPLSLLHPAWKIIYEQSTGRSSFTGRQFTSPDVVTPFGSEQQFRIIRDANGVPIGAEPIERVTPSILEHLLQQVPQYELAKDLVAGGSPYSSADLLDILAGEGVVRDEMGNPLYPTSTANKLAGFAGAPVFETDLADYQAQLEKERAAALQTALSRMGAG